MIRARRTRRHITEAARAAAAAARQAKKALPKEGREFSLFVVRSSSDTVQYTWQIRRFGGVIVQQAEAAFVSMAAARAAGEGVLAKMGEAPSLPPASAINPLLDMNDATASHAFKDRGFP